MEKNVWEKRREEREKMASVPTPAYAQPRPHLQKLSEEPMLPRSDVQVLQDLQWKVTRLHNQSKSNINSSSVSVVFLRCVWAVFCSGQFRLFLGHLNFFHNVSF